MKHRSIKSIIAAVVVLGTGVTAAPSGGQAPATEVVEVSGGAFGAFAEVRSDLLGPVPLPSPVVLEALIDAAEAGDAPAAEAALADVGVDDPTAVEAGPSTEAVLAGAGPVPEVILPAEGGGPFSDSVATIDLDGSPIADFTEVETEGALGPDGFASALSTVAQADLLGLLGGELVSTDCIADLDGAVGSTELVDAGGIISGPFDPSPAPNTPAAFSLDVTFPVDADGTTLTIEYFTILNEQIDDGVELTVNGMHTLLSVRVDPEGPGVGDDELIVFELESIFAQSRCGVVGADVEVVPPPTGPIPAAPTFAG